MGQISFDKAEKIIQRKMPGFKVVRSTQHEDFGVDSIAPEPDMIAPELDKLKSEETMESTGTEPSNPSKDSFLDEIYKKFLGRSRSEFVSDDDDDDDDDDEELSSEGDVSIVTVVPDGPRSDDPVDAEINKRNIVINPRTGEIEGFSG
jgi:hypothetical protein